MVTVMLAARSKQADILMECHRRHTDLVTKEHTLRRTITRLRDEEAATDQPEIDEWFGFFWRQQDDQFVYWQNGLIEDYIYADWNESRLRDFNNNEAFLGKTTFRAGYEKVKSTWCSNGFQSFIDELLRSNSAAATISARRPAGIRVSIIRFLCGSRKVRKAKVISVAR
jgi:hypothetical protein